MTARPVNVLLREIAADLAAMTAERDTLKADAAALVKVLEHAENVLDDTVTEAKAERLQLDIRCALDDYRASLIGGGK